MAKIEIEGKLLDCAEDAVEWFIEYKGAKLVEEAKPEPKTKAPNKKTRKPGKK